MPKQTIKVINGNNYSITVSFIKEYDQAVFIFKTRSELFEESTVVVLLEDEIEIFQKENGYYGKVKDKTNPTLRYYFQGEVEMVRYIKEVHYIRNTTY